VGNDAGNRAAAAWGRRGLAASGPRPRLAESRPALPARWPHPRCPQARPSGRVRRWLHAVDHPSGCLAPDSSPRSGTPSGAGVSSARDGRVPPSSPARPGRVSIRAPRHPRAPPGLGPAAVPARGRTLRKRSGGGPRGRRRGSEGLFVYPPLRTRPGYDLGEREACSRARHTVRPGESLWSIAGDALATDEGRRIAFYWPRIYRANRRIVGSNPDLIYPGQELRLPPECGR
jgi:resuscitation-promoting factor RpfA